VSEEWFDVVDDRDTVVGRQRRADVHRLGLKHRAVHVLVFNRRGELFLQERSPHKDCFPGAWDSSASGHLDAGEDYDGCAVRELREELGLALGHVPERLFKVDACAATGQEFVWVYRCQAEGPFQLEPEEIERGEWISPSALAARLDRQPQDFASGFVAIWREYRRRYAEPPPSSTRPPATGIDQGGDVGPGQPRHEDSLGPVASARSNPAGVRTEAPPSNWKGSTARRGS
jgi:isopentenyldiphosphate isomerase